MLVWAQTSNSVDPVRVSSTTDGKNLNTSDDTLLIVATSAGKDRAGLVASNSNDRVLQIETQAMRPGTKAQDHAFRDGHLQKVSAEQNYSAYGVPNTTAIRFNPISDRSALGTMSQGGGAAAPAPQAAPAPGQAPAPQQAPQAASGPGISGTVRAMTAPELAAFQDKSVSNGETAAYKYAVFVFDFPQQFTALSADGGSKTKSATMALLGSNTPTGGSQGGGFDQASQHTTMDFSGRTCHWPSDASLPLGEPRCFQ